MLDKAKKTLYEILGITPAATREEVKKAYHDRAQETHPDKEGGSQEAFLEVSRAYKILSSEEKRREYDETGVEDDSTPKEEDPAYLVLQIFIQVISNPHFRPKQMDAFESTKAEIEMRQTQLKTELVKTNKEKARFEDILSRVEKAPDLYTYSLKDIIQRHDEMSATLTKNLNIGIKMLEVLKDFKYRIDKQGDVNVNNNSFLLGTFSMVDLPNL